MVTTAFDLDSYLDRIGWRASRAVDLPTLTGLVRAHMAAIPFENFDVLLGRGVSLDLASLQCKIVERRRGGYCFEHATLFAAALDTLGFAPLRHVARVVMLQSRDAAARTHMFVTVALDSGVFVVDPGFGAQAPRIPVPLVDGAKVRADGVAHWMQRVDDRWLLRTTKDDAVVDCWMSALADEEPIDFAMGNHYTATHPASPFVNGLLLRAITPRGQVTVMNREATIDDGGTLRRVQLADRAALRRLVAEHFGFDLPEIERLRVPAVPEWASA